MTAQALSPAAAPLPALKAPPVEGPGDRVVYSYEYCGKFTRGRDRSTKIHTGRLDLEVEARTEATDAEARAMLDTKAKEEKWRKGAVFLEIRAWTLRPDFASGVVIRSTDLFSGYAKLQRVELA